MFDSSALGLGIRIDCQFVSDQESFCPNLIGDVARFKQVLIHQVMHLCDSSRELGNVKVIMSFNRQAQNGELLEAIVTKQCR